MAWSGCKSLLCTRSSPWAQDQIRILMQLIRRSSMSTWDLPSSTWPTTERRSIGLSCRYLDPHGDELGTHHQLLTESHR